jgi:glycosyltransferase involved in cell wall biosynthesis
MPVRNGFPYLREAIDSVLAQTYPHWELIVVDDGSSDQTHEYLSQIDDPRVCKLRTDGVGVAAARNLALKQCGGEYITFLDADDVLPSIALEARVNHFRMNPDVDIVDGIVDSKDEILSVTLRRYEPYFNGYLLSKLVRLDDQVFFGVVYMIRRCCIVDGRFREDLSHSEDLDFYTRMAHEHNLRYSFVPVLVYIYRVHSGSASRNLHGLLKGYIEYLDGLRFLSKVSYLDFVICWIKILKILILLVVRRRDAQLFYLFTGPLVNAHVRWVLSRLRFMVIGVGR